MVICCVLPSGEIWDALLFWVSGFVALMQVRRSQRNWSANVPETNGPLVLPLPR
jgi:hypothetical protein